MSEQAIIEVDVGLQARTKSEIDEYLEKVNKIKEGLQDIRGGGGGGEQTDDDESEQSLADDLLSAEGKKKKKSKRAKLNRETEQFFQNPKQFIEDQVKEKLMDQFEDVLEAIPVAAIAILAVKVTQYVMAEFVKKGGPFNRDFRRFIAEEVDVGLSRELVKMRELGVIQTIIPQTRGFVPNNPAATYNSLIHINESRIARIGLEDRAAGVRAQ